ncbi:MAG: helix-turn-helix domain-containing protein [Micromonosporaceae bacterium]|nr:helix-turn-helix domain-containing protein [Micromonosporaceae bacterium]
MGSTTTTEEAAATPRRPATEAEAKAVASAVRLRILRVCLDQPMTNQEIAARLDTHPATILHHVRKLVATGFLAPQPPRRGARGAREIPYLATRKSWTLDLSEYRGDRSMIDAFLQEVALVDPDRGEVVTSRLGLRLTPEEYAEVVRRLTELLDELARRPPSPDGRPYSMFLAIHPDPGRS